MGNREKTPPTEKHWSRMRDRVVPRHMRKPVDALEEVVGELKPLLDPHARRAQSFVKRVDAELTDEQRRERFEDIIDKAEAVCRQVRIQQGLAKEAYETPVLKPILGRLSKTQPIADELRGRGISLSRQHHAIFKRQTCVDSIFHRTNEYADWLKQNVTADTLWNAYRADFKGRDKEWLTPEQWQENLFIQNMPETTEALRPLVQARAMQKLARKLDNGQESQASIARALAKFMAKLSPHHRLFSAEFAGWITVLNDPTSAPEEQTRARHEMSSSLKEMAERSIEKHEGDKGGDDLRKELIKAYQRDVAAYYKKSPLEEEEQIGLFEDDDARAKRSAEIDALKDKEFKKVLDAAPHLRDQINAARAEAALRAFEPVIYTHRNAVEKMYPYRATTDGQGEATSRSTPGGKGGGRHG